MKKINTDLRTVYAFECNNYEENPYCYQSAHDFHKGSSDSIYLVEYRKSAYNIKYHSQCFQNNVQNNKCCYVDNRTKNNFGCSIYDAVVIFLRPVIYHIIRFFLDGICKNFGEF